MTYKKRGLKRFLAILLSALLIAVSIPLSAAALESVSYIDENGDTQTVTSYAVVDLMENSNNISLIDGWNVVTHDVTVSGTIYYNGSTKIILCDGATLTVEGRMVPGGVALTIYGQQGGTGTLDVNSSLQSGSGISASPVTINGGTVISRGGNTGAGISGTVVINGGTVTATGGASGGAGIGGTGGSGGMNYGTTADVTINGGVVTATGGRWNPGIGNGYSCAYMSGSVTINGGNITATDGVYAAGIGTGQYGRGMNITINGGTVRAQSGSLGDGIGNGQYQAGQYYDDKLGTVTINGGNIQARGGQYGISGTYVNLSWTELTDTIYEGSYNCTSGINFQKDFIKQGTNTLATNDNIGNYTTLCAYDGPYVYASFIDYDGTNLTNPATDYYVTQKLATGGTITRPVDPVKAGFTFAGWYYDGASYDFSTPVENDITLTAHWASETAVSYLDEDGVQQVTNDYMPLFTTENDLTLQSGMYAVTGNITVSQRIVIKGDVHIILADGYTLTAPEGICVGSGNSVTFYGQAAGTGTLTALLNYSVGHAAIGSNAYTSNAGAVTINGGTFNLRGGSSGAGIGGGIQSGCGTITINGGTITARPYPGANTSTAAGIGTGSSAGTNGGSITINGGDVTAYPAGNAAAIGGAQNSWNVTVNINGGNITADSSSGGTYSSGIGGSHDGFGITVNLNWTTYGSDSIYATKYKAIRLNFLKDFNIEGTGTKATPENMDGVTIVPRIAYNVSFVDSDGVTDLHETVEVSQGYTVSAPEKPAKPCCVFLGWQLNGADYDFTAPVTQNITLTANWIDYGAQSYIDENGGTQTCSDYTVLTAEANSVLESGWYAVTRDTDITSRMTVSGTVNLILCDGVTLNAFKGITVENGNTLNIYSGTAGTGELAITETEDYCAGIGSYNHCDAGSIIINGGNIVVYSGVQEAAIGGGESGSIIFNGGNIDAEGFVGANTDAPDGSGYTLTLNWNSPDAVYTFATLIKAEVTLEKDFFYQGTSNLVDTVYIPYGSRVVPAADFLEYYDEYGNRRACTSYTVIESSDEIVRMSTSGWYAVTADTTINARLSAVGTNLNLIICDGATLTVKDIRLSSSNGTLTIYGQRENTGVINALGKTSGYAGIGTNGGTVNIYGCTVNAEGGNNAAGIGGGSSTGGGTIRIQRAAVNAAGGSNAAGIGGGSTGAGGIIEINNADVTATGGSAAAGIGNGYNCTAYTNEQFNITVNGGNVTANGGAIYQTQKPGGAISGGAGIGSGAAASSTYGRGTINISGGNVTANGVNDIYGRTLSAGIGLGTNVTVSSTRIITVNLGWTNPTDSIYATSYSASQINLYNRFVIADTLTFATVLNINGETIVPFDVADIDADGDIDLDDYALLKVYIEGTNPYPFDEAQLYAADINKDIAIDAFDAYYLDKVILALA